MTTPALFTHDQFGQVRVIDVDGDPWFVAADVCRVLGLTNPSMAVASLDEDERSTLRITEGGPEANIISEPGMYALLARSRRPEARAFDRWVRHEVLPAIRRTGGYSAPVALPDRRALAQMVIDAEDRADQERQARQLAEAEVEALTPSAAAWDHLAAGTGDVSVGDAAKILSRDPSIKVGQGRLFTVLNEAGWIYRARGDGRWRVRQTAVETRRLCEAPSSHYHPRTGELIIDPPQVRITFKGVRELHARLGGSAPLVLTAQPELGAVS